MSFRRSAQALRELATASCCIDAASTQTRVNFCLWLDMTRLVVGRMACQFDRQIYGNEIEFSKAAFDLEP
jgi:hypothetical protein